MQPAPTLRDPSPAELKRLLTAAEPRLETELLVAVCAFERNRRRLTVALTARLRRSCRKGRVWKSRELLTALKNAAYGFDPQAARSPGGRDGIFLLTRDHRPKNEMMRKLFDRFLDREDSGAVTIARELKTKPADLLPVRLVSHHLRLLGLLHRTRGGDTLVLVDYDGTKG